MGAGVGAAAGLILGAWMGEYAGNEVQRRLAGIGESFDRLFGTYTPRPLDLKGGDGKDFLVGGKAADRIDGMSGDDILCGDDGDDLIYGGEGDDSLYGDDGNDTLVGDLGDDRLYGGRGNDLLDGRHGNDVLIGGEGSDMLMGGAGDDVYVFELGGGQDQIADISGNDAIVFEKGVDPERVVMERLGSDLLIQYSDNDCVLVKNAYGFADGSRFVERIIFKEGADKKNLIIPDDEQTGSYKILFVGAVWNLDDIVQRVKIRRGTDGNDNMSAYSSSKYYTGNEFFYAGAGDDTVSAGDGDDIVFGGDGNDSLSGQAGDDRLSGDNGNDSLYGDNGDDMLVGGRGDDSLSGGPGDDVYVFNLGDGNDVITYDDSGDDRIVFGQGVTPDSLLFRRENNDLVIRYGSAGDSVRIRDAYYWSDGRCFVESIEFADGTKCEIDCENLCLKAAAVKQTGVAGAAEIKPAAAGCAACFDAAGFIAGVEEYAAAKNLPWVSGSAGYRGKTAADSGLPDSGQDYSVLPDSAQADSVLSDSVWSESVLSESSGCGSAVYDSGSAVEAGINNFTDLIIQDMCELAAGSACASASAAAAPAAQSAPVQLWAC